ncbi:MAG TPA: hypothetical protein ENG33_09865 [Chloroflexi bacterium]|nr:hypothetical protein [Chloroflexota bacterium]
MIPGTLPEIAVEVPTSVREALGDKAALDMVPWLMRLIPIVAVSRDEFREVLSRLDRLETRMTSLEGEVKDVKLELQALRREMNERFDRMYERMLVQTRWLVGSIAVIGTIISILLAIGQIVR